MMEGYVIPRELEGDVLPDGSLLSPGWFLRWTVGDNTATLDGEFTSDDLRIIAGHMEEMESRRRIGGNATLTML